MLRGRLMTKLSSCKYNRNQSQFLFLEMVEISVADQVSMEKGLKKTITQVYKELDDSFLTEARKE